MITSFDLNVHINVGVSPELMQLLSAFQNPKAEKIGSHLDPKDEPKKELKKETKDAPKDEPKNDYGPKVAEEPAATEEEKPKEYTEQDVRAAMHDTRTRIEGEGYKDNTDSEGYKKWHRQLTAWFKNTASTYGAEKPSALADSDSRRAFIDDCQRVIADGDKLTIPLPF